MGSAHTGKLGLILDGFRQAAGVGKGARIGELIAAEEGLAAEHRERIVALQQIEDGLRKLSDEQAKAGRALEEATKSQADLAARLETTRQANAELEKAIADAGKPELAQWEWRFGYDTHWGWAHAQPLLMHLAKG